MLGKVFLVEKEFSFRVEIFFRGWSGVMWEVGRKGDKEKYLLDKMKWGVVFLEGLCLAFCLKDLESWFRGGYSWYWFLCGYLFLCNF